MGKQSDGAKFFKGVVTAIKQLLFGVKNESKEKCLKGKCFTGDTLVYTRQGDKPIKDIQKGDDIYSRNAETGESGFRKVEDVFRTKAHTIYHIWLEGKEEVKTTAYHPFYVKGKGWVTAINLCEGDEVETFSGVACITKIEKVRHEEPIIVYNFHVEEWASFFVSELKVYVHNSNDEHVHEEETVVEEDVTEETIVEESVTEESAVYQQAVSERIDAIRSQMNKYEKSRTTFSIALVKTPPDGKIELWVSSAGKKGYVPPRIRGEVPIEAEDKKREDFTPTTEIIINGKKVVIPIKVIKNKIIDDTANHENRLNDAEQTLIREVDKNKDEGKDYEILSIGATRDMCPKCEEAAKESKILNRVATPIKSNKSPAAGSARPREGT